MESRPIYLDYQATTPTDPGVLAAMLPYFSQDFGNPHGTEHRFGRTAAEAVNRSRQQVADLINAHPAEIIFTSGATEANNLLLKSGAALMATKGRRQIVSARSEHKAVLEVLARLSREGFEIVWAPISADGLVDLGQLETLVDDKTALVSIMAVNNEIGVIQNLERIGQICHMRGALFHSDAAQACGKIPIDLSGLPVDLMSLSAHKLYGPKGIGAAFVRRGLRSGLQAEIDGGGQEHGLRGGTLPTPLCVGFGAACALASGAMAGEGPALRALRDQFLARLRSFPVVFSVNGSLDQRWPGNLNVSFEGVDAEALVIAVADDLAISSGSACTAESLEPSHVMAAIGLDEDRAGGAVRIGFGRSTTPDEVNRAAVILAAWVTRLAGIGRARGWEASDDHGYAAE